MDDLCANVIQDFNRAEGDLISLQGTGLTSFADVLSHTFDYGSAFSSELGAKALGLLHELVPGIATIGLAQEGPSPVTVDVWAATRRWPGAGFRWTNWGQGALARFVGSRGSVPGDAGRLGGDPFEPGEATRRWPGAGFRWTNWGPGALAIKRVRPR
jgi:hypothetical protein